jgi:hypothetical protein
LLETEYQEAVLTAELVWVRRTIEDLLRGKLTWTEADFSSAAEAYVPDIDE